MKQLALIILLALGLNSYGQSDTSKMNINYYEWGNKFVRLYPWKQFAPPQDTVFTKWGLAQIGSELYVGNGTYWTAAGGSVDTTTISTRAWRQKGIDSITSLGYINTLNTIGASPNANGASTSGGILRLQPASASFGGVVTTGTQTFEGFKSWNKTTSHLNGFFATGNIDPTMSGKSLTGGYFAGGNYAFLQAYELPSTGFLELDIDGLPLRLNKNSGGSVWVGAGSINASAILGINSTTKGFLPPRMTGAQAEAISSPAEGLVVYSTDGSGVTITSEGFWYYDGAAWTALTGGGASDVVQTHTSGATITVTNSVNVFYVNPASTLAALTITLPATASTNKEISIFFGGDVTSGTVVTSLTISPNTGHSILQSTTPSTAEAGECIRYKFNSTNSKWYRAN